MRFKRTLVMWLPLTLKPITFSNKEEKLFFMKIRDKKSIFFATKEVALFLNRELFFAIYQIKLSDHTPTELN